MRLIRPKYQGRLMDLIIDDPQGPLIGVGDMQLHIRGLRIPSDGLHRRFGRTCIAVSALQAIVSSDTQPSDARRRGQELVDAVPALVKPYLSPETDQRNVK